MFWRFRNLNVNANHWSGFQQFIHQSIYTSPPRTNMDTHFVNIIFWALWTTKHISIKNLKVKKVRPAAVSELGLLVNACNIVISWLLVVVWCGISVCTLTLVLCLLHRAEKVERKGSSDSLTSQKSSDSVSSAAPVRDTLFRAKRQIQALMGRYNYALQNCLLPIATRLFL